MFLLPRSRYNFLQLIGIAPVRWALFGMVETVSDEKRKSWIEDVRKLEVRAL